MNNSRSLTRRSFLKTLGLAAGVAPWVTSGLRAQSAYSVVRHASFGASGQAWSDLTEIAKFPEVRVVAVADVDLRRTTDVRKKFPDAVIYQDWRQLLDEQWRNLDTVNVSTPDHMHAPIAMSAMQRGLHVYCEKPLAHDLYEVRALTDYARKHKLVTQMGIQIHSTMQYRTAAYLVRSGVIGKVKESHSWCPKSWGDTAPLPNTSDPVPEGLNWDLWLGGCADRPFIDKGYYHPFNWRKRLDFGTGTLGDMGCHIFDPVFMALGLMAPISVRSTGPAPNQWNWALDSHIHYVFPGTPFTDGPAFEANWYDGAAKPPDDVLELLEGDERPETGSILVGTEGTLVIPHIARPLLYPDKKFKDFKIPEVPGTDHYGQFIRASRGLARATANFSYAGPLTETVLLGTVAVRFPKATLTWDPKKLRFLEPEANEFIRRKYRPGWEVKGL